jgi:hypothetical protein
MPTKEPQFPQQEQIKPIETPEDFQNWVLEEAKKSDDYFEFYKKAVHKFLDLWLEDKKVGGVETQELIRTEALKIATKNNAPLNEFVDKLYKITTKYAELRTREANDKKIFDSVKQASLFKIEEENELKEILESYKNQTGDYKARSIIMKLNEKLEPLGYSGGEFVEKMTKLDERGFPMDNVINYGGIFLTSTYSIETGIKVRLEMNYRNSGMPREIAKSRADNMFK